MEITFQYPPELMQLLIDTIPRLSKGKRDLLIFLQGAGISPEYLKDIEITVRENRASIKKFEIVRTVLTRLNAKGESALRERREILKRVVEFDDFSTCYPNDQLEAEGLVARVRSLVNVKDSVTKISLEREREHRQRVSGLEAQQTARSQRMKDVGQAKADLAQLFGISDPHLRGRRFEVCLNGIFRACGIGVRESFSIRMGEANAAIEQIDGVVELDSALYLVEAKWHQERLSRETIAPLLVSVYGRGGAGGIIVSATGFHDSAIADCKQALTNKTVILCTLEEIYLVLEQEGDLKAFLLDKIKAAVLDKNPFVSPEIKKAS